MMEEDINVLQDQLAMDNDRILERDARIASLEVRLVCMLLELASAKGMQDAQSQQLHCYKRQMSLSGNTANSSAAGSSNIVDISSEASQ